MDFNYCQLNLSATRKKLIKIMSLTSARHRYAVLKVETRPPGEKLIICCIAGKVVWSNILKVFSHGIARIAEPN